MGKYVHYTVIVTGHTEDFVSDPFAIGAAPPADDIGHALLSAQKIFNRPGYGYKIADRLSYGASGLATFFIPASGGQDLKGIYLEHKAKLDKWKARVRGTAVSWVEVMHGEEGPEVISDDWEHELQLREEEDPT